MADVDFSALYSTNEGFARKVKACGLEFDVYVRRLPAMELRKFHLETQSQDMGVCAEAGFKAMARAIRNEDGTPAFTVENYRKMRSEAVQALMDAFVSVNKKEEDGELEKP